MDIYSDCVIILALKQGGLKMTWPAKITQETAQKIIDEFCQGNSSYELADKYDLWQTSICNLISGRSWPKCKRPDNIKELIKFRHEKGLFKKGMKYHIDVSPLADFQNEIIIGSLLGDGHIRKLPCVNTSFSKSQCKKYKQYIDWHNKMLKPYSSTISKIYSDEKLIAVKGGLIVERRKVKKYLAGYSYNTHQHPVFTDLRNKWYPNSKKIVPTDLKLTPLTIAIWFCDDGSNSFDHRYATIATQSFTVTEAEFLCELLQEFNINPTIMIKVSPKTGIRQPILKIHSDSYDNLIELITPHVTWKCMAHKIKWRRAIKQWEYSGKLTEENVLKIYEMSKTHKQYEIAKMFGVHRNIISSLLRGDSYKHLSEHNPYIPKSRRRKQ